MGTVPTLRQMNASPFQNRSSYHEGQSQSSMSSLSVNNVQQQRHSMYENSMLSSSCSTNSQTMQQNTTFQQQQQHQNPIPIPIKKSALPPLQPLGGRADVTAQPDQ